MDILDKIAQVKVIKAMIPRWAERATVIHAKDIIEYYQREQVGQGEKRGLNGRTIQIGQYHPATQDWWKRSSDYDSSMDKSAGFTYYMQWSGYFFDTMRLIAYRGGFYITSDASYINFPTGSYFQKRYANIYELTDDSMKYIEKSYIAPYLDEFLQKEIARIV